MKKIRMAHENPAIKEVYGKYLTGKEVIRKVLHTRYYPCKKGEIKKLKSSRETA
jgi:hypothetical protein